MFGAAVWRDQVRTWNTLYDEGLDLQEFLKTNGIEPYQSILVQVFTGVSERAYIERLRTTILALLPHAILIGATTDGEIIGNAICGRSTVLSFSVFEKTSLASAAIDYEKTPDSFAAGRELAQQLVRDKTKVLILFADGLHTNGDALLHGVESVNGNIMVSGGLAGDNVSFRGTFVFTQEQVIGKGVAGVALHSDDLIVNTGYHSDWTNIGRLMTVTKADKNRVYEIEHMPAVEIYQKYLGADIANKLPQVSVFFPLLVNRKGHPVIRTVLGAQDDGSLLFAGTIHEGDQVQFAYGNAERVLESSLRISQTLSVLPIESIFIYTCSARKRFMPEIEERELRYFQHIAPTAGFFTRGEFYHFADSNELLSQTMTLLLLSEDPQAASGYQVPSEVNYEDVPRIDYMKALAHLINVTADELHSANTALKENEERYRRLIESSPETIAVHCEGKFVYVNQAGARLLGANSPEELYGRPYEDFLHPDYWQLVRERVRQSEQEKKQGDLIEEKLIRLDGTIIDVEVVTIPFVHQNKPATQVFVRDITERKKQEDWIKRQAYFDSLTGLPNRRLFHKQLVSALLEDHGNGNMMAVLFLDLDRFKSINDTLGHTVGDNLLRVTANRLLGCLRETDIVARLGGDEFTILLTNIRQRQCAVEVAERIIKSLSEPFHIQGYEFFLTTSIGISFYPNDGETYESLIKHADTAMYYAKEGGRNNFQIYTADMNTKALERLVIENYLRKALENSELSLYYQPVVEVNSGKIMGMEALLRWDNPELGRVSPNDYIPIAEETGLIVPIGEWALRTACAQNKAWQDAGYPPLRIAVNLSARQILQGNIVEAVSNILQETDLDPKWLTLEMTETIMQNSDEAITLLHKLRLMGVRISLDDFGTGYSSLSYLKRLPINTLKIDQSFVRDISRDSVNAAIAKAIIEMAHTLRLNVIAEGVETEEQLSSLRDMKCDHMQGYLFSKPVPSKEFERLLVNWLTETASW
jgi:diguanylate cyclase (GGDEF)-like protein/PAS domain S-box-containing protein